MMAQEELHRAPALCGHRGPGETWCNKEPDHKGLHRAHTLVEFEMVLVLWGPANVPGVSR